MATDAGRKYAQSIKETGKGKREQAKRHKAFEQYKKEITGVTEIKKKGY